MMRPARSVTPLKTALFADGRRQDWLARQLSERLGREISVVTVCRWVNGVHVPAKATREAIADALGRSVDDLFPDDSMEAAA